jgi:hypothetical protein
VTSGVAVVGLTYDGSDIQLSDLSIFLEIRRGLNEAPSVRGVDTIVPARAGRIAQSRINDMLSIELYGQVTTDPAETFADDARASYRDKWVGVRALFASNRDPTDLVATLEDGTTQTISARPLNIVVPNEIPGWFANVSIELEGFDDWTPGGS